MNPDYINSDTYTGRHTVAFSPRKYKVAFYKAGELAGEGVFFESFGRVNGVESFCRTRYVADPAGNLHCYDSDGALKIIHPADRMLRILTGK